MILDSAITGVVLAGGKARRMGGTDKGLLELDGKPLWRHVADTLALQVETVVVNANRHRDIYQQSGLKVIPDFIGRFPWPTGRDAIGIPGSKRGSGFCSARAICPIFLDDLVKRLKEQRKAAPVVWVHDVRKRSIRPLR